MPGPWPVILSVAAMATVVYVAAVALGRARRTERVHCAERGADHDVTFECRLDGAWQPGRRVDVVRCTAFAEPGHVDCEKHCLRA